MTVSVGGITLLRTIVSTPGIFRVKPSILLFLYRYMRKFQVRRAGENLVIHSHLPPLNSTAYARFIGQHLLGRIDGPSHAQVGVTDACPQRCGYCYNRNRTGKVMDTASIMRLIRELKNMGVVWLGLTGGEPLLNRDLAAIVEAIGKDCASKLFTTGCTLTRSKAEELKSAGLDYVSVSLDHWDEREHDSRRGYEGAFRAAVRAVELFRETGIHVGVSSVISTEMIHNGGVEEFLRFLSGMDADEAWLSEEKPSGEAAWKRGSVITDSERRMLIDLQDRYNRKEGMTVNYLGHFEDGDHFGCNAGNKMVYIDAFGEVSPCVFVPISFGNVSEKPMASIYREMRECFPSESRCFINRNYRTLERFHEGHLPLRGENVRRMMTEIDFGPFSRFMELYYGRKGGRNAAANREE